MHWYSRRIDKTHCTVPNKDDFKEYGLYGNLIYGEKKVKCDWEYNPMHGMEECNSCGATRG